MEFLLIINGMMWALQILWNMHTNARLEGILEVIESLNTMVERSREV